MKMLAIDVDNVKDMTKMTKSDAYEFLKDGVHIVCRVSPREFQEVFEEKELDALVRLESLNVYGTLEFYLL